MPNRSKANARRKRVATQKLERWRSRSPRKAQEHRDNDLKQQVTYGHPGNLGSGTQVGSAREDVSEENKP